MDGSVSKFYSLLNRRLLQEKIRLPSNNWLSSTPIESKIPKDIPEDKNPVPYIPKNSRQYTPVGDLSDSCAHFVRPA
jgi:hypothetical protein